MVWAILVEGLMKCNLNFFYFYVWWPLFFWRSGTSWIILVNWLYDENLCKIIKNLSLLTTDDTDWTKTDHNNSPMSN